MYILEYNDHLYYINVDSIAYIIVFKHSGQQYGISIYFTSDINTNITLYFDTIDKPKHIAQKIYDMGAAMYNDRIGKSNLEF